MAGEKRLINTRWFKLLAGVLLLLIMVAGSFPYVARYVLVEHIAPPLGLNLRLATPSIAWHKAALSIDEIELIDDRDDVLLRVGSASVDINLWALLSGEIHLESVAISALKITITATGSDSNLSRQIAAVMASANPSNGASVAKTD